MTKIYEKHNGPFFYKGDFYNDKSDFEEKIIEGEIRADVKFICEATLEPLLVIDKDNLTELIIESNLDSFPEEGHDRLAEDVAKIIEAHVDYEAIALEMPNVYSSTSTRIMIPEHLLF